MLRLRHSLRLAGEFWSYASLNRAWWLLPLLLILTLGFAAAGATQVVVPYTVYTLF